MLPAHRRPYSVLTALLMGASAKPLETMILQSLRSLKLVPGMHVTRALTAPFGNKGRTSGLSSGEP